MTMSTAAERLEPRSLLKALRAFRRGDFSVRLPADLIGVDGDIAEVFNEIVELNEQKTQELQRLARVVGKEGKIGQRGKLANATGAWGDGTFPMRSKPADGHSPCSKAQA